MKANIRLNVPVDLPYRRTQTIAKKGDANSRFFAVKLTVAGNPIEIADGATVRINVKREDGESKAFAGVVENGMAVCPLPAFATENGDATCTCDITVKTIIDGDRVETLTSSSFEVYVQDTACDDETISQDEARTVLDELILTVQSIEQSITTAEIARQSAEQGRANAEQVRESNEQSRATAEQGRAQAENARQTAETARINAEGSRNTAETSRGEAEASRASAEVLRANNEAERVSAETERATAEAGRKTAEDARATAEIARQSAEQGRANAEAARVAEYGNLVEQIETASAGLPAVIEAQEEARALYAQMNVALYVDEKGDLWLEEAAEQK